MARGGPSHLLPRHRTALLSQCLLCRFSSRYGQAGEVREREQLEAGTPAKPRVGILLRSRYSICIDTNTSHIYCTIRHRRIPVDPHTYAGVWLVCLAALRARLQWQSFAAGLRKTAMQGCSRPMQHSGVLLRHSTLFAAPRLGVQPESVPHTSLVESARCAACAAVLL